MKKGDTRIPVDNADNDQIRGGILALAVFTIGALIGGLISLILSKTNRSNVLHQRHQSTSLSEVQVGNDIDALPGVDTQPTAVTQLSSGQPGSSTVRPIKNVHPMPAEAAKVGRPASVVTDVTQNPTPKRWSTPTRYIMGVFLFLVALVVLFIGRATIPMVVAAALLAVIVDPIIRFFMRRMKYNLAVAITYFLVVAVLLAIPLLAIPPLVDAVNFVTEIDFPLLAVRSSEVLHNAVIKLQSNIALAGILVPTLDTLTEMLNNFASQTESTTPGFSLSFEQLTSNLGNALGAANRILGPTFSVIASLFFTLFMSLQMTVTADEMKNWYGDLIPPGYGPELTDLFSRIRRSWTGFLRGQVFLMFVIGTISWLGGLILGLPQALLLGVIAGVLELIPSLGPVLAAIPAVLLALLFGSTHFDLNHLVFALIVIAFYVLVQLLENQILVPRIMGDAVDLPPLVVLIGTIAGASAFGILGALLATPVIATGNLVFRYVYGKIIEAPPAPPPEEVRQGILESVRGFMSRLRRRHTPDH